ncbi:uncharacterized protein MELLADRAFT_113907 [Melampsora larici-populina 98AG31]|uniref:Uncharacterized protein n=1 Tax=Melampsora larici-populina (strain 98AG31 / pathotype 3-4-7) TaxID=747676 RepID=F4SBE9_MELLP|nr:uncharacterized protein MELLADRAFT_113907 [Melampsora larici-populina 98AG31]EGF98029.1 hypothetical protein MELLADRAFT_113907 [Melampsora larici-populina 98AG31]
MKTNADINGDIPFSQTMKSRKNKGEDALTAAEKALDDSTASDQSEADQDVKAGSFSSAKPEAAMESMTQEEIDNILISDTDEEEQLRRSQSRSNTNNQTKALKKKDAIKDGEEGTADESKTGATSSQRRIKKAKAKARRKANSKAQDALAEGITETKPVVPKKGWKGWELVPIDPAETGVISPESAVSGTRRKSKRRKT